MSTDPTSRQFEEARLILEKVGVRHCWYSTVTGADEAVFFLPKEDHRRINIDRLTDELMEAIPGRKVWVTKFAVDAPARQLF